MKEFNENNSNPFSDKNLNNNEPVYKSNTESSNNIQTPISEEVQKLDFDSSDKGFLDSSSEEEFWKDINEAGQKINNSTNDFESSKNGFVLIDNSLNCKPNSSQESNNDFKENTNNSNFCSNSSENDSLNAPRIEPKYSYEETIKPPKKSFWESRPKRFIAAVLIIAVVGGLCAGGGYAVVQNSFKTKDASSSPSSTGNISEDTADGVIFQKNSSNASLEDPTSVIKKVSPAVVNINVKATGTASYFGGYLVPYEYVGAGSGVIFYETDEKVYIITNNHVVENYTEIMVSLDQADNIHASLVGKDSDSELAVLSILKSELKAAGVDSVTLATFGNSDELEVGNSVIAIGNALGLGKVSTSGIISALGKTINLQNTSLEVIQTDAAINQGNSGGALVNYKGEVIGINTAKSSSSYSSTTIEGMGYAIPINTAIPVIEELLENGTREKPYLGIVGESVSEDLSKLYGLSIGVLIRQILEDSAAEKAGLKTGDVITDFNGIKTLDMDILIEALANTSVGQNVNIRVIRNGEPLEFNVIIQDANAGN